jgi:hypothetical protein
MCVDAIHNVRSVVDPNGDISNEEFATRAQSGSVESLDVSGSRRRRSLVCNGYQSSSSDNYVYTYSEVICQLCARCDEDASADPVPYCEQIYNSDTTSTITLTGSRRRRLTNSDPANRRRGANQCVHITAYSDPQYIRTDFGSYGTEDVDIKPVCRCLAHMAAQCKDHSNAVQCVWERACDCGGLCTDFKQTEGQCSASTTSNGWHYGWHWWSMMRDKLTLRGRSKHNDSFSDEEAISLSALDNTVQTKCA